MVDAVLDPAAAIGINIPELKKTATELAGQVKKEEDYESALSALKDKVLPKGVA
jgi:hypothetical protein